MVLFEPRMGELDKCIYVIGARDDQFDSATILLRYSIPRETWTIEAIDPPFTAARMSAINGNILIQGYVEPEGPNLPNQTSVSVISEVRLYKSNQRC